MKSGVFYTAIAIALSGCSIYEAAHAPPPVEYQRVQTGESRSAVISKLGAPKYTDAQGDSKIDHFEFTDGYNPASKARIVLYAAGDLFTLGLAELIFWPLELAILKGNECHGTVEYDGNNRVAAYAITSRSGTPLWTSAQMTPAAPTVAATENPAAQPQAAAEVH